MSFQLQKGQGFGINKMISLLLVGLGWDVNTDASSKSFDLDASIFGLDENGRLVSDDYAVGFFNSGIKQRDGSFVTPDGAITHTGDNLTGEGDGDDEVIKIDQSKIDQRVKELAIWITMYDAPAKSQHFGMVHSAFVRVADESDPTNELCRYDLGAEFAGNYAVQVGSFMRQPNDTWKFTAVGNGDFVEIGQIIEGYQKGAAAQA